MPDEIPPRGYEAQAQSRKVREDMLEGLREWFETTRHPFDLWASYGICRALSLPVPLWILQEFDAIAERFFRQVYLPAGGADGIDQNVHWSPKLAEILGVPRNPKGGMNDPFEQWKRKSRDLGFAAGVFDLITTDGHNETNAIMLVAWEHNVSEATVRRAWKMCEPWLFSLAKRVPLRSDAPPSRPLRKNS